MSESYNPDQEAARLAPAAVCNIASRVVWLRSLIEKEPKLFSAEAKERLKMFTAKIPFEEELLSGKMDQVDGAIKKFGLI